ncbi:ETC complex I subunit conserved region-domain-containing protein [Lipomyces tetrasporus]|uniref:ETC complex I subunit conserved region-domain-containing protein n=1 Tax=Lipomyces tetrasporus TaxID=54092 RepID=A0AAD7VR26_9ASCO|nr:ETC complex I subunit conserved region-domain-containing protein [Lipomyces tetrasporus]KAJ8098768.1 ETC complex I subunit conserved region-domain-containing protein [Lipomyces tetrasporus]
MKFTRVLRMRPAVALRDFERMNIPYRAGPENAKTGLTGIYEFPNPRPRLLRLYQETERLLKEFPEDSVYRKSVEGICKLRSQVIKDNTEVEEIEQKIGGGLIEELLIQAGEEYRLAEHLLKWKAWEKLEEEPPSGVWDLIDSNGNAA